MISLVYCSCCFFFSSRRRHTRCALVTGVQTCALPISWRPVAFEPWAARSGRATLHHQLLDLRDRLGRVQALRASARAIHDGVAAVQLERLFQIVQALAGSFVARVADPAVGLQQDRRAEVLLAVPPETRATGPPNPTQKP